MCARPLIFCLGFCLLPFLGLHAGWTKLEGCQWVENPANDGDSFHVKRRGTEYLLRLCFVDTPETDARFPDRLEEQAAAFGASTERMPPLGKEAAAFTRELLRRGEFTVYTEYRDARGASEVKRIYAMVEVEGRWLSERLVENGLARVHGVGVEELPDGTSERNFWARLNRLAREAKKQQVGGWKSAGAPDTSGGEDSGGTRTLTRPVAVMDLEAPHAVLGTLPAGTPVSVGEAVKPGFRRILVTGADGTVHQGMCREADLPPP